MSLAKLGWIGRTGLMIFLIGGLTGLVISGIAVLGALLLALICGVYGLIGPWLRVGNRWGGLGSWGLTAALSCGLFTSALMAGPASSDIDMVIAPALLIVGVPSSTVIMLAAAAVPEMSDPRLGMALAMVIASLAGAGQWLLLAAVRRNLCRKG